MNKVDVEAERGAVLKADREALKAAAAKDVEGMVSAYADDASVFPPNAPIATGKGAIREVWAPIFASPGFALSWQTTKAEVSRAGDLAYLWGSYELTTDDPNGRPLTQRGKWAVVSKKQLNGKWKMVADIWNLDQPPPSNPAR